MNSVNKAKERLRKYPMLIGQCSESAGQYAKCVIAKSNVGKHDCQAEFARFKTCLVEVAKRTKMKL